MLVYVCYVRFTMLAIEFKTELMYLNLFFGVAFRATASYYFIITAGYGVYGFFLAEAIGCTVRSITVTVWIQTKDWTTI